MFKITLILLAALALSSAANLKCTEEERSNQICYMLMKPVCAVSKSNENSSQQVKTTFANRCHACKNQETLFITEGECASFPENATFCHPDAVVQKVCTKEYMPVCGMFDQTVQCFRAPCGVTYPNKCGVCNSKNVAYFVPGDCEKNFGVDQ